MSGTKKLPWYHPGSAAAHTNSPHRPPTRPRLLTLPPASSPTGKAYLSGRRLRDELSTKNNPSAHTNRRISGCLFPVFFPSKSFPNLFDLLFYYIPFLFGCQENSWKIPPGLELWIRNPLVSSFFRENHLGFQKLVLSLCFLPRGKKLYSTAGLLFQFPLGHRFEEIPKIGGNLKSVSVLVNIIDGRIAF